MQINQRYEAMLNVNLSGSKMRKIANLQWKYNSSSRQSA